MFSVINVIMLVFLQYLMMRTGLCEHSNAKFLTQVRNYRKTYVRIKQNTACFLVTDLSTKCTWWQIGYRCPETNDARKVIRIYQKHLLTTFI